jgi:O-antigen ligase
MIRTAAASSLGRVAGVTAIALLQAYWFLQPVPLAAKALAVVFLAVSMAGPASGLLVFAALSPLSTVIAGFCGGGPGLGGQMLEQMALSIGAGALLHSGPTEGRTRIGAPALFMAVVAVASAVAMIPAAAAPPDARPWDGLLLHQLAIRQTAQSSPVWAPLFAALVIAECGLLGWAVERTVRRTPKLATQLMLGALLGHAGAALLNINALVDAALRNEGALSTLPRLFASVRLSRQTDVHAAASALLLACVTGFGLMRGHLVRRAVVGMLVVLTAIGLWITGSRVAIALGVIAAVAAIAAIRRPAVRAPGWRVAVAGGALLVIAAGVWLTTVYPSERYYTIARSTDSRIVLFKAGVQMFEGAPIFGIGITRFYAMSAEVVGPGLVQAVGYARENAHNNFLQVLAELGIVGLGAMFWWLAAVVPNAWRTQVSQPDALRAALLVAIAACIGTWLTGHPLLVPEFAFVFWLYFGVLAGTTPPPANSRVRWVAWILVAGVLVSVPLRARAHLNGIDREHRGIGVSLKWQHDDEQRYREAGASFALYLPATGRLVEVPIRRAPGAPDPLLVDLRIGGRLVDTVPIGGAEWQRLLIPVPIGPRRFELVDFAVRPQGGGGAQEVLLRVGRDAVR